MTGEKKRRADTFEILESIPFDSFVTTGEISTKLGCNWYTLIRRLFYLEYKGYLKFIEVRNNNPGFTGVSYAWKRLKDNEPKHTSLSKSFEELLEFIPEDIFESTGRIAKITKENQTILFSKLLYLESRRYVVCFRPGPKSMKNRPHYWKKLSESERRDLKDYDREEIEKRYERECFRYTE